MVANGVRANGDDIGSLLNKAEEVFDARVAAGESFVSKTSSQFEDDVFDVLNQVAEGSPFEGRVIKFGGQRFPDIVIGIPGTDSFYGVEVKTTKKETGWKTTGNSVLESSRIDNVEEICLFFGRMTGNPEFRWRKYEECLYKVAVTHSPRYLIDMDTEAGNTIFDQMEITYNQVRAAENPIQPIVEYHRRHLEPGQDLWWINPHESDSGTDLILKSWNSLNAQEREDLLVRGMVLFPEVFGPSSPTKYTRYGNWLFSRNGVVDASIRDRFTSGGTVTLSVRARDYPGIPKAIGNLKKRLKLIIETIPTIPKADYDYYWGNYVENEIFDQWVDRVVDIANDTVPFDLRSMILEEEERLRLADEEEG